MSEELKPCPFCNAQIAFEANEYGGDHYHPHNDCWLTGTLISGSWVSSPKWNRRASPTPEAIRREALEEAAKLADEAQASAREEVASDKEEMGEDYDPYSFGAGFLSGEITASINIATAIRALSPPVVKDEK